MSSDVCKFITSQCAEFDVLPDVLSENARNFTDIAILKNKIKEDESRILGSIITKLPNLLLDYNDPCSVLRRILPWERDVAEKDQKVKILISYIFSSHKVFLKLINILIYYSSYRK